MVKTSSANVVGRRTEQSGFTYLWVLMCVAILGVGLLVISDVWVTTARRQKIEEVRWIGTQFVQAIGSYYQATPGGAKSYPASLSDLLEDRRHAVVRRHLRAIYRNPLIETGDWELIKVSDGKIVGIRVAVPTGDGVQIEEFVYRQATAG